MKIRKIIKTISKCFDLHLLFSPLKKPELKSSYESKVKLGDPQDDMINTSKDIKKAIDFYEKSL